MCIARWVMFFWELEKIYQNLGDFSVLKRIVLLFNLLPGQKVENLLLLSGSSGLLVINFTTAELVFLNGLNLSCGFTVFKTLSTVDLLSIVIPRRCTWTTQVIKTHCLWMGVAKWIARIDWTKCFGGFTDTAV